jgi:hypothetical protein
LHLFSAAYSAPSSSCAIISHRLARWLIAEDLFKTRAHFLKVKLQKTAPTCREFLIVKTLVRAPGLVLKLCWKNFCGSQVYMRGLLFGVVPMNADVLRKFF